MNSAKITAKGQVTIPKHIRNILKSDVIRFYVEEGRVGIEPVKDVAGVLSKYAREKNYSFAEEREIAWKSVMEDKYGNNKKIKK